MSVDRIQAHYEDLNAIAARFRIHAEQSGQMQRSLQRAFQALQRDGWKGEGADAFFAEMQQAVFPAVGRLRTALTTGDEVLREIVEILRTAEEEAAAPFRGEHNVGQPVPVPFQGGYTFERVPAGQVPYITGLFDQRRRPHELRGGEEVKNYRFKSGTADAVKYEVDVNGRTIPVFVPKNISHEGEVHTIHEVAAGLAALPESSLAVIKRIDVEPKRNPQDAADGRLNGTQDWRSYGTAFPDRTVHIWPSWGKHSQDQLDAMLHHEGGHVVAMQHWGDRVTDPKWNAWRAAKRKDPGSASSYAGLSLHEDFAETYFRYHQVKGTPQEAESRKWMGERFKIIDQIEAEHP